MRKRIWFDVYNRPRRKNCGWIRILLKLLLMKNVQTDLPEKVNPDYKYWNLNIHIPDHILNIQTRHDHQHPHPYNPFPFPNHDVKVSTSPVLPPWRNTHLSPDPPNPLLLPRINPRTTLPETTPLTSKNPNSKNRPNSSARPVTRVIIVHHHDPHRVQRL